jgi:putative peptidoglycan lipid II flippase
VSTRRRLAVSTAVFGAATAASRVAGLVREIVVARLLGSGAANSAFQIAFNVPNLVRSLFADNAITAAFLPVFTELRESGREPEAWRVASIVLWLTASVLGAISALFVLLAPVVMPLFVPGGDNVPADLVVELSRWLFPIVVLLGMTGVVTAILNSYEIFGVPALAPVAWNLVIIATLLAFGSSGSPSHRATVYAAGVLVATVVQFLIPLPLLRGLGSGGGLAFTLAWRNPYVRRILVMMVPVTIGLGLINVNLTIDLAIGTLASPHATSDLNFAFRLFMLPQGLFSVAVAAVLFPEIARLAARGEPRAVAERVAGGTRTIVFLLLPAAALSIVLAEPLTRLLYERGRFTPTDTEHVAVTLVAFSAGLVGNGLQLLYTRTFFALQQPGVPTRVAAVNLVLNVVLDLALYRPLDAAGIALATAIVATFSAVVLATLIERRVGTLGIGAMRRELLAIAGASLLAAVAALAVWSALDAALGRSLPAQALSLTSALVAAGAVYVGAGRLLGLADVATVAQLLRRSSS